MSHWNRLVRTTLLGAVLVAQAACSSTAELPAGSAYDAHAEAKQRQAAAAELLELGLRFASAGDSVRAEQYLAAALDAGANADRALPALLKVCINAGRFEAAAQHAETYVKDVRARRDLELLLGGLYLTLEQDDKAIVQLRRVALKYPELPMAHLLLGRLLRAQAQGLEEADEHFRAYLRLAPEGPHSTEARESLLKRLSETEELPDLSRAEDRGHRAAESL